MSISDMRRCITEAIKFLEYAIPDLNLSEVQHDQENYYRKRAEASIQAAKEYIEKAQSFRIYPKDE